MLVGKVCRQDFLVVGFDKLRQFTFLILRHAIGKLGIISYRVFVGIRCFQVVDVTSVIDKPITFAGVRVHQVGAAELQIVTHLLQQVVKLRFYPCEQRRIPVAIIDEFWLAV
ncbi:MAG: hypothetical protein HC871_08755 [Rhizobiales bacterium]|nr:hypothetical protein [Hyphomicrobiales bacterium]